MICVRFLLMKINALSNESWIDIDQLQTGLMLYSEDNQTLSTFSIGGSEWNCIWIRPMSLR